MEKRYQVFVSSTYADLKEERQHVLQTLMEMDCIPSGMEMFPATDEEQWEFIKKVIDDCDYYLLIIGGRYGSVSDDGISYTEKEYQYAVERGIKVIAFLHEDPDEIPVKKTDIDPRLMEKLKVFRESVSTGRLVKFWRNANELPGLVALSVTKTIKMYPAIGWIRANMQSSSETLSEINELRKENEKLKILLEEKQSKQSLQIDNLASLDETIEIFGTYKTTWNGSDFNWKNTLRWLDIFGALSPYLLEVPSDSKVKSIITNNFINKDYYTASIDDQVFQTIKMQFMALELVDVTYSKSTKGAMLLFWKMTEKGKLLMMKARTVKSNSK